MSRTRRLAEAVKAECGILADDLPGGGAGQGSADGREAHRRSVGLTPRPVAGRRGRDRGVQSRRAVRRVAHAARANSTERPASARARGSPLGRRGLLDFVDHLTDWAEAPVLVLALARPELMERRPTWGGGKRNAMSITLEPLTPGETQTFVRELLGGDSSGADARSSSAARETPSSGRRSSACSSSKAPCGGCGPLGTRRRARRRRGSAIDPGGHRRSPRRVLPDEIDVVQAAAVVGRVFWVGAAQHLAGTAGGRRARSSDASVPATSSSRTRPPASRASRSLRSGTC